MEQQDLQAIKQRFSIIGNSPLINHDIEVAVQVARTDLSVLARAVWERNTSHRLFITIRLANMVRISR